jgi:RimJ/RimL family protein N-acetyltransferase
MPDPAAAGGGFVRRLEASDARHLRELSSESAWISKLWNGPEGLASSGYGWCAFVDGELAAVACTAFLGETYEDIGVVTEPQFRGLGLSPACSLALCGDIRARGHQPSWTTSPDNLASMRVAEKLGFELQRRDVLYVVGIPIPTPARRPGV